MERIFLSEEAYTEFMDILEREPEEMPKLQKLLAMESPFAVSED